MKKITLLCSLFIAISINAHAYDGNIYVAFQEYSRGDFSAAVSDFKPLAESGDASSQYYIGLMNLNGQGLPKDEKQAFQWFEKSAKQGYAKAQNALGEMYYHARGTRRDEDQALFWFRKAANKGLAVAQRNLAVMYAYAVVPHDYKKAVFWLKRAARQGDDIDQLMLARIYYHQAEVQDNAKSAYWMRKAANQGLAEAQYLLGNYYYSGQGVPQGYDKALYWYKRAYSQGYVEAPYSIGLMYVHGKGVPYDHAIAVQWFCSAANLGNHNGIYQLRTASDKEAIDCLTELAKQGQTLAQEELGVFYENNTVDAHGYHEYALAAFWYRKAAEQGYAGAFNHLGDLYAIGNGVPKDPVIAEMLYILARSKMYYGALYSSRIREELSDSQKSEAQSLAKSWKVGTPLPERSENGNMPKQ